MNRLSKKARARNLREDVLTSGLPPDLIVHISARMESQTLRRETRFDKTPIRGWSGEPITLTHADVTALAELLLGIAGLTPLAAAQEGMA